MNGQIIRRAPMALKDHFIDSWAHNRDIIVLAKSLDEYEAIKSVSRKSEFF